MPRLPKSKALKPRRLNKMDENRVLSPEEAEKIFNELKIKFEPDFNRVMNLIAQDMHLLGYLSMETVAAQKEFEAKIMAQKEFYEKAN